MKVNKIFKMAVVSLGAVVALSGCIRETFPKESTITAEQLLGGQLEVMAESLLKGIPSGMLSPVSGWEHTDFGYHSVGCYNDHAAKLIATTGWMTGLPAGYNRFYAAQYGWGYAPNSSLSSHVWYNYYPQIKSCNDIIELCSPEEQLSEYVGIAKTYRALFYLDLARMFEPLYAEAPNNPGYEAGVIEAQALTVPIVDENLTEETAKNNPRATREEMFKFIFADLADAEVRLADYVSKSPTNPTLAVVYGLYARAYLWLGGFSDGLSGELPEGNDAYAKAAEYARKAIDTFGGAIMSEYEWTNPTSGFNTMASSWMWALVQSTDTIINNLFQFAAHMSPEASYGYAPLSSPALNGKHSDRLSNTDFRKKIVKGPKTTFEEFAPYTLIKDEAEFEAFGPYTNFKFRPNLGERVDYMVAGASTLPLMRCEEMYFIEMEAVTHTQGDDAGWALLTQFMANRDSNYICPTMDIVDEIIFQKGIEFWGEGVIMYDMKRLDMPIDTAWDGTNFDESSRFKTNGRLAWWTYCIPQGETQINLGITVNNPNPTQAWDPVLPKK